MQVQTLSPVEMVQPDSLLHQLIIDVARLPEEDLSLVAEFVTNLKQTRRKPPRSSVGRIRAEARRLAAEMKDVPREELAARLIQAIDAVRAEAAAKGITVEGEWRGD